MENLAGQKLIRYSAYLASALLLIALILFWIKSNKTSTKKTNNSFIVSKNQDALDISLPIFSPVVFNGLSKEAILETRSDIIKSKLPPLVGKNYVPTEDVFRRIKDFAYWFSLPGFYYYGKSENSVSGLSVDSKGILNPFLLIIPEFWGISIWGGGSLHWDENRITETMLADPKFHYAPKLKDFLWSPSSKSFIVTYDVTGFFEVSDQYLKLPLESKHLDFGITTYNARDFNLHYVYLDEANSMAVENPKFRGKIGYNDVYLGYSKDLCGNKLGCNGNLKFMPAFDSIKIKELPASAKFKLWSYEPESAKQEADMNFEIRFF